MSDRTKKTLAKSWRRPARGIAWTAFCATLLATALFAAPASAGPPGDTCYQINSWSSTGVPGQRQASYQVVSCQTIPIGWGWTEVNTPSRAGRDYVRINLSTTSPKWRWNGALSIDSTTVPYKIYSQSNGTTVWLAPYPPHQANVSTMLTRVRWRYNNKCIYLHGSPATTRNWGCYDSSGMTFYLKKISGSTYQLQKSGKCLQATGGVGTPLGSGSCSSSNSSNEFYLSRSNDSYRILHLDTGLCVTGSGSDGGFVILNPCGSGSLSYSYKFDKL